MTKQAKPAVSHERTPAEARTEQIVFDIVEAVRDVLRTDDVTFEEYRTAVHFLMDYVNQPVHEVPLMCDLWFNAAICDIESAKRDGSATAVEGPYFMDDIPVVTDRLKTKDDGEPLVIQGAVTATDGRSVAGTKLYIWHSNPQGYYSGYADDFPKDYYRGIVELDETGRFSVKTTMPAPYTIPLGGITNRLLTAMGRHPWRPAHLHFKLLNPEFLPLTTQAHFENFDYMENDCVNGVRPSNTYLLREDDSGKVLDIDFTLDPAGN
ncbi:catechol 1,2-dioxygenase [Parasphingopyxis algicola]|uniref:dioxygenase family protein n=1 Tax=Parasphingopyxis algicola TaxID=2026624 RepID=UPI0015A2465A|nr:dioxygenase [Parasphingopyxis algicola]QLC25070.1 catechol 1,2-dioxygenase [Parasphingopyxis algicola]